MTKKEMFSAIREVVANNEEMVAFIDHEIELLERKSSSKKPTKTQLENNELKAAILDYMSTVEGGKCIKDLQSEMAELAELSNQKVTHLLTDLVKSGSLVKEYVKKTPYYSLAE